VLLFHEGEIAIAIFPQQSAICNFIEVLMRSRAARMTFVAVAWIALGIAGYFLFNTQKTLAVAASAVRAVDQHAREADDALADLRVGQQAYVASGQGVGFWMPKVAATLDAVNAALNALRQAPASPDARAAGEQASAAVAEFADVDKRARDYIRSGQTLMAADVIFTEGGQLAAVAARQVETARIAEHQAFDAQEAAVRKQQASIIGAGAGVAALIALLLGATGGRRHEGSAAEESSGRGLRLGLTIEEGVVSHAKPATAAVSQRATASRPAPTASPTVPAPQAVQMRSTVVLKAAADLSTEFGRARDEEELGRLLGRAADMLDASGLIVWITDGDALRPVLSHGYSPAMLARMSAMPRSADNAAAAACRTGSLQIVLSKPGGTQGAIVAPILTASGCMGALSAEIKDGGEGSEAVQAIAAIVAAHLAGVVAAAPAGAAAPEQPVQPKAAHA
jgi:CHASE3 domain sensor protein